MATDHTSDAELDGEQKAAERAMWALGDYHRFAKQTVRGASQSHFWQRRLTRTVHRSRRMVAIWLTAPTSRDRTRFTSRSFLGARGCGRSQILVDVSRDGVEMARRFSTLRGTSS